MYKLGICFAVLFALGFPYFIQLNCFLFIKNLVCKYFPVITSIKKSHEIYSSVFCRGSNHTDRMCHFKNLCYEPKSSSFVFLQSSKSVKSGIPFERFTPALVDFSSVYDHNLFYFDFIEIPFSTLKHYNLSFIYGNSIMFKRFNPENIMHVFHDDLLPAFSTLLEASVLYSKHTSFDYYFIFADDRSPGPYSDIYTKFLNKMPVYLNMLPKSHLHCFESVYVGLNKDSTWYQYGFKTPQGPLRKSWENTAAVILNFREYFLKQFSIPFLSHERNCSIFLNREKNRKILNENDVVEAIFKSTNSEVDILSLEKYSVIEIVKKMRECQVVVGMHGSLLILSLFLRPFSVIIELFPYGVNPILSRPYKTLADMPSLYLTYNAWENVFEHNSLTHPEYPAELGGILHLPVSVQQEIETAIVSPFLCCDNPIWLYRMYQDTLVDISSLGSTIQSALETRSKVTAEKKQFYVLHPSQVTELNCAYNQELKQLNISWQLPWNLSIHSAKRRFCSEYEVWIQTAGSESVEAYLLKKMYFLYPVKQTEIYYVWVRCILNSIAGPFNSVTLVCSQ